jgi:hypothetical protein
VVIAAAEVPKSNDQSVAVAFVGVMPAMYGAAKSVIAAALRRKFWNATDDFPLALGDALDFINFGVSFQIS